MHQDSEHGFLHCPQCCNQLLFSFFVVAHILFAYNVEGKIVLLKRLHTGSCPDLSQSFIELNTFSRPYFSEDFFINIHQK